MTIFREWIAQAPDALGEDLLIIQKEFAGFDGTQERLDLLALDTAGRLVIVENKLDDSGKDVIWQALKYAAYCSTLKSSQIVDIYHRHQGKGSRDDAIEGITQFLASGDGGDSGDGEDLALNPAGSQRIMLVAANFRKEITSTALWLLGKGVGISCIQVTPYQSGEELFLDVSRIIPAPETSEYMIQLAEKTASDDHATSSEAARHKRRRAFWAQLIETAESRGLDQLARRTAGRENWMSIASGITRLTYSLVIKEGEAMVQFNFETADKSLNKSLFDIAMQDRERIEAAFSEPPEWRRLDDITSSRIVVRAAFDGLDPGEWAAIIDWQLDRLSRLEAAVSPLMPKFNGVIRKQGGSAES